MLVGLKPFVHGTICDVDLKMSCSRRLQADVEKEEEMFLQPINNQILTLTNITNAF